jgi:transcription antitermination factor NusA-like protein
LSSYVEKAIINLYSLHYHIIKEPFAGSFPLKPKPKPQPIIKLPFQKIIMDAHADAVARAKAIAARLAGLSSIAAPAVPGDGGAYSYTPASTTTTTPPDAADVSAMLDAALGGGGGGATTDNNGGGAGQGQQPPDLSRKRGVEEALASLIPGLGTTGAASGDASKRLRTDGVHGDDEAVKKIWIPSDRNPGYNYVGLLIGPGGSKQRELVASSGGNVKISIRGKGSNSKGGGAEESIPGMPEEPLHVLIEGRKESVDRAEQLVRELLEDSDAADREKARQLGSMNPESGIAPIDGAVSAGGYTPKPVAQILGQTSLSAYGPPSTDQGATLEEKIGIPNGVVGFVIGRGGESIASMQRRTGCRVQIQKEHEMAPGTSMRVITLTANDASAISDCRAIIEGMVRERMMASGGPSQASSMSSSGGLGLGGMGVGGVGPGYNAASQMAQLQKALSEGQAHVTIQVPDADVGLIIGKGGAQIRNIQEKSGANVQIPQVADANNPLVRTVNITHPNREGGEFAKQMIEEVLATKMMNNAGGGGGMMMGVGGGGGEVTIQLNVSIRS